MIRKTKCLECEDTNVNCIELGMDGNWICISCLRFNLDLYTVGCFPEKKEDYVVTQNTEKIDPDNVPF